MSPTILLPLCLLLVLMIIGIVLLCKQKAPCLARVFILLGICAVVGVTLLLSMVFVSLTCTNTNLYPFWLTAVAVLIVIACGCGLWGVLKKKFIHIPLILCAVLCLVVAVGDFAYHGYAESLPTVGEGENLLRDYAPYTFDSKVAKLDEDADLHLTVDLPKMDGATALYPIYSAFAKAVYPKEKLRLDDSEYVSCNTTAEAYLAIVGGKSDIIFVAAPSEKQKEYAKNKGVELEYTPIGKEAFVFFVNSKNPIDNLAITQIQNIYSGEITKWSTLGVSGLGKIKAFQREEGSGSQSALLRLMGNKPILDAPTEVIHDMGGIIERTADYKNYKNAIGYSFRFYSTEMVQNNKIKLLSIDGVAPTLENIEKGTYPLTSYFYAVTRKDCSQNTKKLLHWIQGKQGQELIEKTGYTAVQ